MIDEGEWREKTDEELASLAIGDQTFFACIIKRYKEKLLIYIKRISNVSNEDAQDILQDVFIKVYKNLNDFDANLKFSSWIYRITRNEVISAYRKRKSRPQNYNEAFDNDILEKISSNLDMQSEVDLKYLRENIYKILNNLNPAHKEILVLKFFEEKDYKEISDIIKKPMGTVASLMNRAKKEFEKISRQKGRGKLL